MRIRNHHYAYCIVVWLAICINSSLSQAQEIQKYIVRSGTLEPAPPPKYGYIFKSAGEDQFFDMGPNTRSIRGTFGIYDLTETGFKLDNGKQYLQNGEKEGELHNRAARENPGAKVSAILFRGEGDSILEVRFKGKTPVYRVDLRIAERDVTLWLNREDPGKAPEKRVQGKK